MNKLHYHVSGWHNELIFKHVIVNTPEEAKIIFQKYINIAKDFGAIVTRKGAESIMFLKGDIRWRKCGGDFCDEDLVIYVDTETAEELTKKDLQNRLEAISKFLLRPETIADDSARKMADWFIDQNVKRRRE